MSASISTFKLLLGYKPKIPVLKKRKKRRVRFDASVREHYPVIKRMLKENAENAEIGKAIGRTPVVVGKYIQADERLQELSRNRTREKKPFQPHRKKVKRLLLEGKTLREMSKEVPLSYTAILRKIMQDDELRILWRERCKYFTHQ